MIILSRLQVEVIVEMARYKPYTTEQGIFAAVFLEDQLQTGTFEHTLNHLINQEFDLTFFNDRYKNDETGAPAYNPKILLKIILFAYSRGITSSRKIEQCCKENLVFMALAASTHPHFTTIADFVATMDKEVIDLFREVLLTCDEMGLIGKEMFAIDGCKLPSNASKEWSGTKAEFDKKADKLEHAIRKMVDRHHQSDNRNLEDTLQKRESKQIKTMQKHLAKIRKWLAVSEDKIGKSGKPIKSNVTDNESAKMKSSRGIIQGYNGVTTVDSKHQVIVHAKAVGQGNEQDLLEPMVEETKVNFKKVGKEEDVFAKTKLSADSGFHSENNMKMLSEKGIDAYVADNQFRKRDPRFIDYDRFKKRSRKERSKYYGRKGLFTTKDFTFAKDLSHCICPAGKRLYRSGYKVKMKNFVATKFKAPKSACVPCELRSQCLRKPEKTEIRQVAYFHGRSEAGKTTFSERMKTKIDSTAGRLIYSLRVGIVEPPFAHICQVMGLNRFSHRGKKKVNTQWNLFTIVHNIKKIHRYGLELA